MAKDKPDDDDGDKPILIYTTFPTRETAEAVADALLDRHLIACANIIPGMVALYRWRGQHHRDVEVVMILKTRGALAEQVIEATKRLHPYETPALVALRPVAGDLDYFAWIAQQTSDAPVADAGARNSNDASP